MRIEEQLKRWMAQMMHSIVLRKQAVLIHLVHKNEVKKKWKNKKKGDIFHIKQTFQYYVQNDDRISYILSYLFKVSRITKNILLYFSRGVISKNTFNGQFRRKRHIRFYQIIKYYFYLRKQNAHKCELESLNLLYW